MFLVTGKFDTILEQNLISTQVMDPHLDRGQDVILPSHHHSSPQHEPEWDGMAIASNIARAGETPFNARCFSQISPRSNARVGSSDFNIRSLANDTANETASKSRGAYYSPIPQQGEDLVSLFGPLASSNPRVNPGSGSGSGPGPAHHSSSTQPIGQPSTHKPPRPACQAHSAPTGGSNLAGLSHHTHCFDRLSNTLGGRLLYTHAPPTMIGSGMFTNVEKPMDNSRSSAQANASNNHNYHTPISITQLLATETCTTSDVPRQASFNSGCANLLRGSGLGEGKNLPDHLYNRGLLAGRHSDIIIVAFATRYNLHKLILDRAPFFALTFSEPWTENSAKQIELNPQDIDPSITQTSFELALKRLYGCDISEEEDTEAIGLFATGCWLEMQELIDSAILSILRQMCPENLASIIKLVTSNYYGRAGERLLSSAKAMLCRDGSDMHLKYWDNIPGHIVQDIVSSDGFFVLGEWQRWNLARRLLDRRMKQQALDHGLLEPGSRTKIKAPVASLMQDLARFVSLPPCPTRLSYSPGSTTSESNAWLSVYAHPDVNSILLLLDNGVHYLHLSFEQLQHIQKMTDIFGLPVLPNHIITNALFMQIELRQRVVNAKKTDLELGLSKTFAIQPSKHKDHITPIQDAVDTDAQGSRSSNNKGNATDNIKGKAKEYLEMEVPCDDNDDLQSLTGAQHKFWIPTTDCSIVMGGNVEPQPSSASAASTMRIDSRLSAAVDPSQMSWTPDIMTSLGSRDLTARPPTPTAVQVERTGQSLAKPLLYSNYPPFRFSAEFLNLRNLKEEERMYSQKVFYAGNFWRIYIQKLRGPKQNVQLGVYLRRTKKREYQDESCGDVSLGSTTVDERIGLLEREMLIGHRHSAPFRTGSRTLRGQLATAATDPASRSTTAQDGSLPSPLRTSSASTRGVISRRQQVMNLQPRFSDAPLRTNMTFDIDSSESESENDFLESAGDADGLATSDTSLQSATCRKSAKSTYSAAQIPAISPYIDSRPTVRIYFKIYSPSKAGRLLSVYESAPDQFNICQSWGWRSTTLMPDEGFGDAHSHEDGVIPMGKRNKSGVLRFSVVIGNL